LFWKVRKEPDPLNIKVEVGYILLAAAPVGTVWAVTYFVDPGHIELDGSFTWHYFLILALFVYWSATIPATIVYSQIYNYREKRIGRDSEKFDNLLSSEIGINLFAAHLASEHCVETLVFWRYANAWKSAFDKSSDQNRYDNLKNIYEQFIKEWAPLQVNLSNDVRSDLDSIFDSNKRELSKDSVDDAIQEVYILMFTHSYVRFLQSEFHDKYQNATFGKAI